MDKSLLILLWSTLYFTTNPWYTFVLAPYTRKSFRLNMLIFGTIFNFELWVHLQIASLTNYPPNRSPMPIYSKEIKANSKFMYSQNNAFLSTLPCTAILDFSTSISNPIWYPPPSLNHQKHLHRFLFSQSYRYRSHTFKYVILRSIAS